MKQIQFEPTIVSVMSFMNGLNDEQKSELFDRLKEKQPSLYQYSIASIIEVDPRCEMICINLLFIMLRCFELFYGELTVVSEETCMAYGEEANNKFQSLLKKQSLSKVRTTFRYDVRQKDLVNFIDDWIDESRIDGSRIPSDVISFIKISNYFTIELLNREIQKMSDN